MTALLLTAALALTPTAPPPADDKPQGLEANFARFFDMMAQGKDVVVRDQLLPKLQAMFDRIAQRMGITDGRMTRQQFMDYLRKRAAEVGPSLFAPTDPTWKAVLVSLKGGQRRNLPLLQARVTRLGGEPFLVGVAADDWPSMVQPGYAKGQTVWVALGEVATVTEYASEEELKKFLEHGRAGRGAAPEK